MNADGTNQTNISNDGTTYYYPSWSPDGSKIAFASPLKAHIWVMNPDGTKIAFSSYIDGNFEIYVLDY